MTMERITCLDCYDSKSGVSVQQRSQRLFIPRTSLYALLVTDGTPHTVVERGAWSHAERPMEMGFGVGQVW